MAPLRIELLNFVETIGDKTGSETVQIPGTDLNVNWDERIGIGRVISPSNVKPVYTAVLPRVGDRFETQIDIQIPHPDAGNAPTIVHRDLTLRRVDKS